MSFAGWPPPETIAPGGGWPAGYPDWAFSGSGLCDRAWLEEAIEAVRPLADAGDEVAELWLADCDRLGGLHW